MSKDLYNDEYDFKELNNAHLKRPAAVTIKKPLLQADEMSDLLTRLLINYVPPEKTGSYKIPEGHAGLSIRAFTSFYTYPDEEETVISDYIKWSENIFLKSDLLYNNGIVSQLSVNYPSIIPFNNLLKGADLISPARVQKEGEYLSSSQSFNKEYLLNEIKGLNIRNVTVYLLDEYDHKWLNPNEKGISQNDILRSASFIFLNNELPKYCGKVAIYAPGKLGIQIENDTKISRETIKRAYGKLPSYAISAYKWTFSIISTKMAIADTKIMAKKLKYSNQGESLPQLFYKLKNGKRILEQNKSTEQENLKKETLNIIDQVLQFDEKNASAQTNISVKLKTLKTALTQLSNIAKTENYLGRESSAFIAAASLIGPYSFPTKVYPEATTMLAAIYEYEKAESEKYLTDDLSRFTPVLAFGAYENSLRMMRHKEVRNAYKETNYVTSKNMKLMSNVDFKIRYYSLLISKIREKIKKYYYFIDQRLLYFPYRNEYISLVKKLEEAKAFSSDGTSVDIGDDFLEKMENGSFSKISDEEEQEDAPVNTKAEFVRKAEKLLFGPFNGLFATSVSTITKSVISPYYNSVYDKSLYVSTTETNDDINSAMSIMLEKCQNKDIASISLSRVVSGISQGNIKIKNDKLKYNFPRENALDRTETVFSPMDEIFVYLPTIDGKVSLSFTGVVSSVSPLNDGGYNSISLNAECKLKYLRVNRTNMKPSMTVDENFSSPVTPFLVPSDYYRTVEHWMPLMFAQSLSYFYCMPGQSTDADFVTGFVKTEKEAITDQVDVSVAEVNKVVQTIKKETTQRSKSYNVFASTLSTRRPSVGNYILNEISSAPSTSLETQSSVTGSFEKVEDTKISTADNVQYISAKNYQNQGKTSVIEVTTRSQKVTIGYYNRVDFSDKLYNVLWYRAVSSLPDIEANIITDGMKSVLQDYVSTEIKSNGMIQPPQKGIEELTTLLKSNKRAAYYVYKTRFSGLLLDKKDIEDREIVAKIIGTSQPSFVLQSLGTSLQFSNWKTNLEILNDVADKFNFLLYTDKNGIVLFTPYNFDLTTLNTNNYTSDKILTDNMLTERNGRTLEYDDSVQILKKQYVTSYTKNTTDSNIINWLRITGSWPEGGIVNTFQHVLVTDPYLMKKFGVRTARNRNVIGVVNEGALRLYGLSWMDRQNKTYRSADISGIFDSRMDINLPYYVPYDSVIYFAESLNITYIPGSTCTYSMGARFGKKPLLNLSNYVVEADKTEKSTLFYGTKRLNSYVSNNLSLKEVIKNLFVDENRITVPVYAQYTRLFAGGDIDDTTKNASICCYNGYLWDNVSGISFEELVYNYGWIFGNESVSGFTPALGIRINKNGKEEEYKDILVNYLTINGGTSVTTEEKNAVGLYFINIPSITNTNKLPEYFDNKEYVLDDLKTPGIIGIRDSVKKVR